MAVCVNCHDPLMIRADSDESEADDQGELVPDELALPCGCLFHWQCFLDSASEVSISLKCPTCGSFLPANQSGPSSTNTVFQIQEGAAILARYKSEGGLQENLDMMPYLTEEAYLAGNPDVLPARALQTFCTEGDIEGIIELLTGEPGSLSPEEILRYQDPLNGMKHALHLAIEADQVQAALLLLYLGSGLPNDFFPADALQAAHQYGLHRDAHCSPERDIRTLKDGQGHTAEDYASRAGGRWTSFIEAGMFA